MVGVGRGAQAGVLIKNAEALERMEKVDTLVIDKTGTLTEGKPKVVAVVAGAGLRRGARCCALPPASSAAASIRWPPRSSPPRRSASSSLRRCDGFDAPAGKGVIGMVEGKRLALGNAKFLHELNIDTGALADEAERLRGDGATAIFLAVDGKPAGVIAIADPVKATHAGRAQGARGRRHARRHAHRRQPHHRAGGRPAARHHRGRGRGAARSEKRGGRETAPRGPRRRHGRRRRQRRAGARRRRSRHRHGHRHRCRDRKRRHHAAQGRSHRHRARRARCRTR